MSDNKQIYTKEDFLKSTVFAGDRDIVRALLKADKLYSKEEVQAIIEEYRGRAI